MVDAKILLRKFHALCHNLGISADDGHAIVEGYGHTSSRDMTAAELSDAINKLTELRNAGINGTHSGNSVNSGNSDVWRKRVMASVGAWLRMMGYAESAEIIKGVACRATGYEKFNDIPEKRLADVYYEFKHKQKVHAKAGEVEKEMVHKAIVNN